MKNIKKHAYLLMLHHRKDLVDLLIEAIDDERNDIFVHIDPRCREFSFDDLKVYKSNIYNIENPIKVNWGGYSQIKCELLLMNLAYKHGSYAYYHLIQGSSYPLKSQDELHKFYDERQGTEFVDIDNVDFKFYDRIKHVYLFNDSTLKKHKSIVLIEEANLNFQEMIKYDHFKKYKLEYRKGFALWSITDGLLKYVLDKEKLIEDIFKYSVCGDELFMQIIAYNSPFKNKIAYLNDNYSTSYWASTWLFEDKGEKRAGHNFKLEDLPLLIDGKNNFARKFEGPDGVELINKIKEHISKS